MVFGRKYEQERLNQALNSNYSEFIAVYGRRRIGKTFLIRETFSRQFTFQHAGIYDGTLQEQISAFCDSLSEAGLKEISEPDFSPPENWFETFNLLKKLIKQSDRKKKVIFLDELSWMDTQNSKLIMALENFWNGWASARKDVLLIVCASATSWILDKVIHNKGGLYNRLSAELALKPFTLLECKEYIQSKNIKMNPYQLLECYMIMGGVPYYWGFLKKGLSLSQNIDRIFFAENAPLRNEFSYLYQALFRNPEDHIALISALCKKKAGLTREELIEKSGVTNSGALTKKLEELEVCGFIRKYKAVGMKTKGSLYQLIDNFTLFYYKFMTQKNQDPNFWEHQTNTPERNAWCGLAFERVCLEHIPQIKKKLGISGVSTEVKSWSCHSNPDNGIWGSQIDLVIVRKDQVINLCEIKYSTQEYAITKKVDESLRHKLNDFMTLAKTKYALHTTVITTYGLVKNSYAGNVQAVVTAEDLITEG